jgi:cysteinyl-tRNA synthetase
MTLKLFNTLTKKKEEFIPINKEVGFYTCGPTVYHYAHIGNLRGFMFYDLVKRVLMFNDFRVNHVMNITDVGHLTSDEDEGEDKMLKGAKREKKTVWEIADFYTQAFKADMKKLNCIPPKYSPKATEHIREQIDLIETLEKKKFTYRAGGNVYFNTAKLKDYGKLANLKFDDKRKSRVELDTNKKNPHDFVLWFTKSKFQDQEMKWSSPWGEGYPGWHIECSAMSMKYLGEQFDIHCGGIDHIPVHHTNEIAQSEAATGKKPWVKYWLHNEFLVLDKGEKMAKSAGDFLTLSKLEEMNFTPLAYRYFCLGTHYRKQLMFSKEGLEGAKNAYERLKERILEFKKNTAGDKKSFTEDRYLEKFKLQINDDLNTPKALATLWEVARDKVLNNADKYWLMMKFDDVLGLDLNKVEEISVPEEIVTLAEKREEARKNKDWAKSDQLRDLIKEKGFIIEDSKEGYKVSKL